MAKKKRGKGHPPHAPTEQDRARVKIMTTFATKAQIAKVIGISRPTLLLYYKRELEKGPGELNSIVVNNLFALTKKNPAAAIFWCKTRLGWRETLHVDAEVKPPTINVISSETVPEMPAAIKEVIENDGK